MKTTLDLPNRFYSEIKAQAALKGQTIQTFVLDAIRDKLAAELTAEKGRRSWRTVFGKADPDDVANVQRLIDEEFSRVASKSEP